MLALRRTLTAARPLGARSFSAVAAESNAPPVKMHGIPARYASATYIAASKAKKLDDVEKELMAFRDAMLKKPLFFAELTNPTVSRAIKVKYIQSVLEGDKRTSLMTKNLMLILAGNDRMDMFDVIVERYITLMKAKRGEVDALLTTATPISKSDQDLLAKALAERAGKGKKVLLKTKIDETLLAGMVVQIGDQIIDMSLSTRINELKRVLTSAPPMDFSASA